MQVLHEFTISLYLLSLMGYLVEVSIVFFIWMFFITLSVIVCSTKAFRENMFLALEGQHLVYMHMHM